MMWDKSWTRLNKMRSGAVRQVVSNYRKGSMTSSVEDTLYTPSALPGNPKRTFQQYGSYTRPEFNQWSPFWWKDAGRVRHLLPDLSPYQLSARVIPDWSAPVTAAVPPIPAVLFQVSPLHNPRRDSPVAEDEAQAVTAFLRVVGPFYEDAFVPSFPTWAALMTFSADDFASSEHATRARELYAAVLRFKETGTLPFPRDAKVNQEKRSAVSKKAGPVSHRPGRGAWATETVHLSRVKQQTEAALKLLAANPA